MCMVLRLVNTPHAPGPGCVESGYATQRQRSSWKKGVASGALRLQCGTTSKPSMAAMVFMWLSGAVVVATISAAPNCTLQRDVDLRGPNIFEPGLSGVASPGE